MVCRKTGGRSRIGRRDNGYRANLVCHAGFPAFADSHTGAGVLSRHDRVRSGQMVFGGDSGDVFPSAPSAAMAFARFYGDVWCIFLDITY